MEGLKEKPLKIIFLLGAGASRDAGIPTINELTKEFVNDPAKAVRSFSTFLDVEASKLKTDVETLANVTEKFQDKMDLELMMSLILRISDKKEKQLLETTYHDLKSIDNERIQEIKNLIQGYIRKKCEDITSVEYFWPLEGMSKNKKLDIFTLNYDGTVEIFCEERGIKYTDGFEPDWNIKRFDDNESKINLYKLHGSLYWFRTKSNKTIKIPMKGLQTSHVKYLTDEEVSEMMIYPSLEKNKQLGVYSWLSQKFKDELNSSDVCVVIGYSFRDGDIRESIIESLSSNLNLWLIIVGPNASRYKNEIFSSDYGIASRIVTMNMGMIGALTDRTLNSYLSSLSSARQKEQKAWEYQSTTQTRLDNDWNWILNNYLMIDHHDRVKWIVEELSIKRFTRVGDNFPNCVEGIVGSKSLKYLLEYHDKKEEKKLQIWGKIFVDYCIVLEYGFFKNSIQTVLQKSNPIQKNELPFWYTNVGSQPKDDMKKLINELQNIKSQVQNEELQTDVGKLVETLTLYVGDNGQLENSNPGELIKRVRDADLGMKKWANKIINSLQSESHS